MKDKRLIIGTAVGITAWMIVGYLLAAGIGIMSMNIRESQISESEVGTHSGTPYKLQSEETNDPQTTEETHLGEVISQTKDGFVDSTLESIEQARIDAEMQHIHDTNAEAGLGPNGLPIEEDTNDGYMVNEDIAVAGGISDPFEGDFNDYDMGDVILVELREYTIKDGDNWWKIAEREYGAGARSYALARFNRMTIETPLKRGMVIGIPTPDSLNLLRHSYYDKED